METNVATDECSNPLKLLPKCRPINKRNKSEFRKITEQLKIKVQKNNPDLELKTGSWICNRCRNAVNKIKPEVADNTSTTDGTESNQPNEAPISNSAKKDSSDTSEQANVGPISTPIEKVSKHVICPNFFNLHATPLRRDTRGPHWYYLTKELGNYANKIGYILPEDKPICMECKLFIISTYNRMTQSGNHRCCNPFSRHLPQDTKKILMNLQPVKPKYVVYGKSLNTVMEVGTFICAGCRLHLKKMVKRDNLDSKDSSIAAVQYEEAEAMEVDQPSDNDEFNLDDEVSSGDEYVQEDEPGAKLTRICEDLSLELPSKTTLKTKRARDMLRKSIIMGVDELFSEHIGTQVENIGESNKLGCTSCRNLVEDLQLKFFYAQNQKEKYNLLTATPNWVSTTKMIQFFEVSQRVAETASKLKKSFGPVSAPQPRIGLKISETVSSLIEEFYLSPDNSCVSPARRETVVIRKVVNGVKEKTIVPKQRIMSTLNDLYNEFKSKNPAIKISKSKFSQLRPKQCVWGGKQGFRNTCLCTIHTNFSLLCDGIDFHGNTEARLVRFFCSVNGLCFQGLCEHCPNLAFLCDHLETLDGDDVEFWAWEKCPSSGRIELQTKSRSKDEVTAIFRQEILKVAYHHFIFKQQRDYIAALKAFENIHFTHGVMNVDFAQNYSFVLPNETQGFHWSNTQATIHPFVLYYKETEEKSVKCMNYIVISDSLKHDATTFHVFRCFVMRLIKEKCPWIKVMDYVSDGAGSQYKNCKNFANLHFHEADFGIKARWTFSASSHGKDVVDGLSAVTKRLTRLESLRRTNDFIRNPKEMFQFLDQKHKNDNTYYIYVTVEDIEKKSRESGLESRYKNLVSIPGTMKFHNIDATFPDKLICKNYATCVTVFEYVFGHPNNLENVAHQLLPGNYAAFIDNNLVFYGIITSVDETCEVVEVQIMKPSKRAHIFSWYEPSVLRIFSSAEFIGKLSPPSPTSASCRLYSFCSKEMAIIKESVASMLAHGKINP